eukprot:763731-Hanusia_phi.AAC.8
MRKWLMQCPCTLLQVESTDFQSCLDLSDDSCLQFRKRADAGRNYETLNHSFESDLFAVSRRGRGKGRRVTQEGELLHPEPTAVGGDDLGDAEDERRDAVIVRSRTGIREEVPAFGGAGGKDPAGEGGVRGSAAAVNAMMQRQR